MLTRLRILSLACLMALVPLGPAYSQEMSYGWCELQARGGDPYYQSSILQASKGSSNDALEEEFAQYVQANIDSSATGETSCWMYYGSPIEAKDYLGTRQRAIQNEEHKSFRDVGWTGNHAAVEVVQRPNNVGPHLTIKTDTGLVDARKQREQAELNAQRDQAAALAKRVADTARAQAEMQAKLAKLFDEMRKRGSAQ